MDGDGVGVLTIIVLVGLLLVHNSGNDTDTASNETVTTSSAAAQRGSSGRAGDTGEARDRARDRDAENGTSDDDTVVTIGADVLFEFGTTRLTPIGAGRIASVAAKAEQGARMHVSGHTDSIGGSAMNQRLSEQRADAVATAIATARPDLRLVVRGFGESRPVADNTRNGRDHPAGREKNRRVEIRY